MDYRQQIRIWAADIINGKKDPSSITHAADFFYVQAAILRFGRTEIVKQMGLIAKERNAKKIYSKRS